MDEGSKVRLDWAATTLARSATATAELANILSDWGLFRRRMGEADYYSIDVSWDGDDVERRLEECGVLEMEGGRNWKCSWERLGSSQDRESICCGVYNAPAVWHR